MTTLGATISTTILADPTAMPHPGFRTGVAAKFSNRVANAATQTLSTNVLYAVPIWVPVTTVFSGISIAVVGVGSTSCQLGICANGAGVPDALFLDAGSIGTTTNGEKIISVGFTLIGPAVWWGLCAAHGAPSVVGTSATWASADIVPTFSPFSGHNNGYSQTGISGALPSPWGATITPAAAVPCVYLTVA